MAETTGSLRDLTTGEQVQEDLPATLRNLRETSESAKGAAGHAESVLRRVDSATRGLSQIETSTDLTTQYTPDRGAWRTDLNVSHWSVKDPESRYIVGWRDIGEGNNINLQRGMRLGEDEWLRAGLVASKLGIGYDRVLGPRWGFAGELYDPNDLTLDIKGFYRHSPDQNWRLLMGIDKLFETNDLVVGGSIRY